MLVSSVMKHPVVTNSASKRATEKIFYTKIMVMRGRNMHWIFVYSSTLTCQGWSTLTNTFFFPLAGQKKDLQNLISVSLITLHYRKRKDFEKQDLPSSVCALLFIINSKNDSVYLSTLRCLPSNIEELLFQSLIPT